MVPGKGGKAEGKKEKVGKNRIQEWKRLNLFLCAPSAGLRSTRVGRVPGHSQLRQDVASLGHRDRAGSPLQEGHSGGVYSLSFQCDRDPWLPHVGWTRLRESGTCAAGAACWLQRVMWSPFCALTSAEWVPPGDCGEDHTCRIWNIRRRVTKKCALYTIPAQWARQPGRDRFPPARLSLARSLTCHSLTCHSLTHSASPSLPRVPHSGSQPRPGYVSMAQ